MNLSSRTSRVLQYVVSGIVVLLSGLLLKKNTSLSTVVDELNELTGSKMDLSDTSTSNILTAVSGCSTLIDKGLVYLSSIFTNSKTQTINGRLPIKTLGYMTSVVTGEIAEHAMWYSSMVVSMIKNGDISCGDTASLLQNYNLTNIQELQVSSFFDGNLSQLANYNADDSQNATVALKQSELILGLSQHCQINKASIGLSAVNFFIYVITSGVTASSFFAFYLAYKDVDRDIELEFEDPFMFPTVKEYKQLEKEASQTCVENEEINYIEPTST